MSKRNDYFSSFGITTITFADGGIENLEECFLRISSHLKERPKESYDAASELAELAKHRKNRS
jgi:hypothetical protein